MSFDFLMKPIVENALTEDLGQGDLTTEHLPELRCPAMAYGVSRAHAVISGLAVAACVWQTLDPTVRVTLMVSDGDRVVPGNRLLKVEGLAVSLLQGERVALNFLQHLSGVASRTRQFADAIAGTRSQVTDTRKTTPGLRFLEKQAVVHGGGSPHRFNLGSAVMLKDNHIAVMGGIEPAVARLRAAVSHTTTIEVEADTLAQVEAALRAGADIVMLDNMSVAQVQEAVTLIGNRAISEASGGITLETIRAYAETGVQYISTSQITMGAPPVDIGLDIDSGH